MQSGTGGTYFDWISERGAGAVSFEGYYVVHGSYSFGDFLKEHPLRSTIRRRKTRTWSVLFDSTAS